MAIGRIGYLAQLFNMGFQFGKLRSCAEDEAKRAKTLAERGLDFADAHLVFAGRRTNLPDDRRNYGEPRFITAGWLRGRFVILIWTPRGGDQRIISMRYGHADEEAYYEEQMDRSR